MNTAKTSILPIFDGSMLSAYLVRVRRLSKTKKNVTFHSMFKSIPFVCDFIVRVFVFIIFCEPQMATVIASTFWSSNKEKGTKHFIIGLLDCEVTEEHNVLYIS